MAAPPLGVAWLLRESIRSGTIAALAIMPFGLAFRAVDLRVGHYGPKFAEALFGQASPGLLFVQHLVIGWLSALPLLWVLPRFSGRGARLLIGAVYGAGYYVVVNSLALPLAFGDPTPWRLGPAVIGPSLVVHLVFGIVVALAARIPADGRFKA